MQLWVQSFKAGHISRRTQVFSAITKQQYISEPNRFENLFYGIYIEDYNTLQRVIIDNNEFKNNTRGIYLANNINADITRNKFNIGEPIFDDIYVDPNENAAYGIYLHASTGYRVDENEFQTDKPNLCIAGIIDMGYETGMPIFYNNIIEELPYGIITQGNYWVYNNYGLRLKCNRNTGNLYDFICLPYSISSNQGTLYEPAGNLFSACISGGMNINDGNIQYFYHLGNQAMIPQCKTSDVALHASNITFITMDEVCPSSFKIDKPPVAQLITKFGEFGEKSYTLLAEYIQLVDGNKTDWMLKKIKQNHNPKNMKKKLLDDSPWLSDTVMVSLIKKENYFTPQNLTDILVANPQSAINYKIQKNLDEMTSPLPQEMRELIDANSTVLSPKTEMETRIESLLQQKEFIADEIIKYYLEDTLPSSQPVLKDFLLEQNTLEYSYKYISYCFTLNDITNAVNELLAIPSKYNLDSKQTANYEKYKLVCNILIDLKENNKTIYEITSQQEQVLRLLANDTLSHPGIIANKIICRYDSIRGKDWIKLPYQISPIIPSIYGYIHYSDCDINLKGFKVSLLDTAYNEVISVNTNITGKFTFKYSVLTGIDKNVKYTFGHGKDKPFKNAEFKTLIEWTNELPLYFYLDTLQAEIAVLAPICYGDSIYITSSVTGGIPPYNTLWSFGNDDTSIVVNPVYLYDLPGTYNISLFVTDSAGCSSTAGYTITIPEPMELTLTKTDVTCYDYSDGSATSAVTGGVPPYEYLWNTGAETQGIVYLQSGEYSVTVTDGHQCTASGTVTVTEPASIEIIIETTPATCIYADGTATVTVSGGTPPYAYLWNTGAETQSLASLQTGEYTVTVTNSDGCTAESMGVVESIYLPGMVTGQWKISRTYGNFTGILDNGDSFGYGTACIGDLDGDGIKDLAVGAPWDDDNGIDKGAIYILFMNADRTVKSHYKISSPALSLTGGGIFGTRVDTIGDLDLDGRTEIAVGADFDNDGGAIYNGALWIISLNTNGTIKWHQKISDTQGNFTEPFYTPEMFGSGCAALGDLDNDGVNDIAAGMRRADNDMGAIFILFLNSNGTVKSYQKIGNNIGGFTGGLDIGDNFGRTITSLGDLDGDNTADIAVGAYCDSDEGYREGAVWLLFLNNDGTVKNFNRISDNNFGGVISPGDYFGSSVESINKSDDINGDGVTDMLVGALFTDDGGADRGAVWVLYLNSDGTVNGYQKISQTQGCFSGQLDNDDRFGSSVTVMGDFAGDGTFNIGVGSAKDDDGVTDAGAVWILSLEQANFLSLKNGRVNDYYESNENISEENERDILAIEKGKVQFYVYPNPYMEATTINYILKDISSITLEVFSLTGRKIHTIYNGQQFNGSYRYEFSAKQLGYPAGTYLLKIDINNEVNSYWLVELK
ncbi:MAG: FG-GAP repeat protein [Bacteroidia bacterium]|nr:FG-GAP repeat protein [Bacteroidia bacterium]